jgi:hypothetical protein
VGGIVGAGAYARSRYLSNPHRRAMEVLRAQAAPGTTLVVGDQTLYEQLYPFLRRRYDVRLVETHDYLPDWEPRLAAASQAAQQLWICAGADSPLHGWAIERFPLLVDETLEEWRLSGWETR